jgi:hypothetical protein
MQSTEMFINMKDVPVYNPDLHFFEQSREALEFYAIEEEKIKSGVTIGGFFIHPWLYWHINFFKAAIPVKNAKGVLEEPIITTPFRDNELYIAHMLHKAELEDKGLAAFGTRRFAKSTFIASYLAWKLIIKPNGTATVAGKDKTDLATLSMYIKNCFFNIHPAFRPTFNKTNFDKEAVLGFKTKSGSPIEHSTMRINNLNSGVDSANQKTAGASPSAFIIDEFGKFNFIKSFEAAMPSFETPFGWKTVPLLVGTGGNETLSQDAQQLLTDPAAFKMLSMDWEYLDGMVKDKKFITWKHQAYGMFVPAQMSYKTGITKIDTNLGDYLGIDSEELKEIDIGVTDWEKALSICKKDRADKAKSESLLNSEKMAYPLNADEPFLQRSDNPFPAARISKLIEELVESGDHGKPADIYLKQDGTIGYQLSDKSIISEFPYKGGTHDAPVLIFDEPPETLPLRGLNVSGLDTYNQTESTTSSLGAFYILRRQGIAGDTFAWKILASYSSRPQLPDTFDNTCMWLMSGYNAECLMEATNSSFVRYLTQHKKDWLLADGVDLAKTINPKTKQSNRKGLGATTPNQEHVFKRLIQYCNEQVIVGYDDYSDPIYDLGIVRINDIHLLKEMKDYRIGSGNYDRIIAFGHALVWAEYMDETSIPVISADEQERRLTQQRKRVPRKGGFYSKKRSKIL